ncbi:MAG: HAD-IA family hydrolase [Deltaproteobacteria bacterium]|jgi:HAD superfamily hydrolase (TIGR01549 family)|nr:HAD-IA family hydrolase [Deltaproteobacteria bacterium]
MALDCIVFDCDGVILDSLAVKTRAFVRLAEPFGAEAVDRLVMYHKEHGGVSRYKKFEWLYREVLGREITQEELAALGRQFAELALEEVCRCDLIPGVEDVLRRRQGLTPMYVCSGTPHEELNVILRRRGLHVFFAGIYGTPPAKSELLRTIVGQAGADPASAVMVGDSVTDLDAAKAVGTRFYGCGAELKGGDFPWGEDLTALNAWLDALQTDERR